MIGIIISIISIIISIIVIIDVKKSSIRRASDEIQRYKEVEFQKEKEKYIEELDRNFLNARQVRQEQLLSLDKEIENKKEFNNSLLEIREKELNSLMEEKKKTKELQIEKEIEEWAESAQEAANEFQRGYRAQLQLITDAAIGDMQATLKTLEEYKEKQDAINKEILREKELKLKKDIHRIILSEEDKNDITFLISILSKINHKETVYKLIWSEYLMKPFQDMIKNSFGGKVPKNVIYCIESADGKLKYIGKTSADVSKRWTEHIKTSLNIGGVSRSKLHDALYLHWDEFLFSVIEETTKEQLSEREKYYINFFESDKYGLNIKSGG